jgi:hypothetical protein
MPCARPVHALAVHRHSVGVRVDRVGLLRRGLTSQRLDRVLDAAQRIWKVIPSINPLPEQVILYKRNHLRILHLFN